MADFKVKQHQYRSGKMDAFKQMHVARRLSPFLPMFFHAMKTLKIKSAGEVAKNIDVLFLPFTETIAGMKDEDVNYIVYNCLRVTQRQVNGDVYSPVAQVNDMEIANSRLMFEDLDMGDLLMISWQVIQENLMGFFPAQPVESTQTI